MATIKAGCTKCGKAFGVLEEQMGTEVQCPHCQARMKIPVLKRPSSSSPSAPKSDAESALDAAAAQLGGPSKPRPAATSKPQPRGDGLDELFAATQGKPAAPKPAAAAPKPAARPEKVASRTAHGHSAGHSHLDDSEEELLPQAPAGLMKNPGVVYTLAGVLVLIIIIFVYFIMTNKTEVPDIVAHEQTQDEGAMTAAKSAAMAAVFKKGTEGRGPVAPVEGATPLTMVKESPRPDEYFGRKNQLAHFAMFENTTGDVVERAAATISVWDGPKMLTEKTFTFRDVQPGQKVPAIITYPFIDNPPKYQIKWRHWSPDKPVYKFEASVLGVRSYGESGGTVTVEVRNDSDVAAPVVDITVILMDTKSQQRIGFVTATTQNLKPKEGRNVEIRWDGFDSDSITGGMAYAQLGGAETE